MENATKSTEFRALQFVWDVIRNNGREELLCSPLFPVFLSITFYFVAILPFMIIDLYGKKWHWVQQYKIQPDIEVTWPKVKQAMWVTFWNHILCIMPAAVGQWIWQPPTTLTPIAPTVLEYVWQLSASLVIFDFYYFCIHTCLHKVRFLYRWIHAIHHEYHSPFSWVTQYLHPWELAFIGIGTTATPWLFDCHIFTQWSFMLLNIFISVESHVGFDFPWAAHHWFPFGIYGGAPKHDMHHNKPMTNFQPVFNTVDILIGAYCPPIGAGGYKSPVLQTYEANKREERKHKYQ